jgi:protein-L-isoaspartate O-methyltransferase
MKKAGPDQIPASWVQRLREPAKMVAPVAEASEKLAAERAEFNGFRGTDAGRARGPGAFFLTAAKFVVMRPLSQHQRGNPFRHSQL